MSERRVRRYRRLTLRVEVSFLRLLEGTIRSGVATTLGAGGLFIRSDDPLDVGEPLRVRFALPGSPRSHEIDAEVVWANGLDGPDVPASGRGMGVAFRDPAASRRLAQELERWAATRPESQSAS